MDKKVSELGEKQIVEKILHPILGDTIGDDCAIIELEKEYLVATIDKIPEKPLAFELGLMSYYDMGYYLAVANLSDVASMGARPLGFIAATAFPSDFEIKNLQNLISGIKDACETYNTLYIGGDTGEASSISLVGAAFGIVNKNKILRRNQQRVGDIIFTTGYIGLFSTALVYFLKAKPKGLKLSKKEEEILKSKLIRPKAKFKEAFLLSETGSCTSCMDISDGFSMSIYELMKINKKGVLLYAQKLPIHEITYKVAEYLCVDPLNIAFGPGADFELVGSVKENSIKEVEKVFKQNNKEIFFIGKVTESKYLLKKDHEIKELTFKGWQHFVGDAKDIVLSSTLGNRKND